MSTIRSESKVLAGFFGDLDNLRNRYVETNLDNTQTCIFPGFEIVPIEKNQFRLFLNCSKVEFKSDWIMRPDYVSYDTYGTVIYWPIILFVNGCFSIEDFNGFSTILIPSSQVISELISDKLGIYDYYINPEEISVENETRYYKLFSMNPLDVNRIVAKQDLLDSVEENIQLSSTETELRELTEEFILTDLDIANSYIDLSHQPVNSSSITLNIDPYLTSQAYGYDYILKYESTNHSKIRISWNKLDCTLGDGLDGILETGNTIKIKYIYSQLEGDQEDFYENDILDGGIFGG